MLYDSRTFVLASVKTIYTEHDSTTDIRSNLQKITRCIHNLNYLKNRIVSLT